MLWQYAFLDTRWRFFAGLMLLTLSAAFVALGYPNVAAMAKAAPVTAEGALGRDIAAALAAAATYDGYVWSQWFSANGSQLGSFFAALIGAGGLMAQNSAARLFILSLPVSRERLLGARAAAGLVQVLALALVPALTIAAVSPVIGETYSLFDALVYALCLFAGAALFFSVAFLFSTMIGNVWAPVALTFCTGAALGGIDRVTGGPTRFSLLGMMHGQPYFAGQGVPWLMLAVSAAFTAALLYAGVRLIARRDF